MWLRAVIVGLFGRRCDFTTDFIKVGAFCVAAAVAPHGCMGAYTHTFMHASSRLSYPPYPSSAPAVPLQRRGRASLHMLHEAGGGGRAELHPEQAGALPRVALRERPPAPPDHRARLQAARRGGGGRRRGGRGRDRDRKRGCGQHRAGKGAVLGDVATGERCVRYVVLWLGGWVGDGAGGFDVV